MRVTIPIPDEKDTRDRLIDTIARAGDIAHQAFDRPLADALHAIQKAIKRSAT